MEQFFSCERRRAVEFGRKRAFFFVGALTARLFFLGRAIPPRTCTMPTHGTHTPDVPYQPSSDMAWGARGHERMKSASDREYEERVRSRQRRCSILPSEQPRRGGRKSLSMLDVAFNVANAIAITSKLVRWILGTFFFVHRKLFGIALVVLGQAAPGKAKRAF
jgi:hypothetical protein